MKVIQGYIPSRFQWVCSNCHKKHFIGLPDFFGAISGSDKLWCHDCMSSFDAKFELLDTRAATPQAPDASALELLRRFYDAWQNREDDNVIDALVTEMGAVLKRAERG